MGRLLPSVVVAAVPEHLVPAVEASERSRSWTSVVRAYFMLTKPRVIELLLVTTVPAMVLAEDGLPSLGLIAAVLLGGALSAGGANTINCWIERDRGPRVRARARGHRLRLAGAHGQPALGRAVGQRHALLHLRVHDLAQAAEP